MHRWPKWTRLDEAAFDCSKCLNCWTLDFSLLIYEFETYPTRGVRDEVLHLRKKP